MVYTDTDIYSKLKVADTLQWLIYQCSSMCRNHHRHKISLRDFGEMCHIAFAPTIIKAQNEGTKCSSFYPPELQSLVE